MSDRPEWDAWDFGEDEEPLDEPYDDGAWAVEPPAGGGGAYERTAAGGPPRGALLTALAVMVVLAMGIAAAVLADDDDDSDREDAASELDTNDRSTSSSSSSTTSTTAGAAPGDTAPTISAGSSSTSTPRATSTTRRGATTTTAAEPAPEPACASSPRGQADPVPADWADRWQTMPRPNDPATISICIDDATPKVGQTVLVTLRGDDPDAVIVEQECGWRILWEGDEPSNCRDFVTPHDGPRPTPPQEPGHVIVRRTHVYGSPGGRTIVGTVQSSRYEGYTSPYASSARAELPIVVHP